VTSGVCRFEAAVDVAFDGQSDENSSGCHFEPGVDYEDDFVGELRDVPDAGECAGACLKLDVCTHFSWVGNESAGPKWYRNCYLKGGVPTGRKRSEVVTSGRCTRPSTVEHRTSAPSARTTTRPLRQAGRLHAAGHSDPLAADPNATATKARLRAQVRVLPSSGVVQQRRDRTDGAMAEAVAEEFEDLRKRGLSLVFCASSLAAVLALMGLTGFGLHRFVFRAGSQGYSPIDSHGHQNRGILLGPSQAELARGREPLRIGTRFYARFFATSILRVLSAKQFSSP